VIEPTYPNRTLSPRLTAGTCLGRDALPRLLALAYQCELPSGCMTRDKFETNSDPLWNSGPRNGSIDFCDEFFAAEYTFCPRAWKAGDTSYYVAEMDKFAQVQGVSDTHPCVARHS